MVKICCFVLFVCLFCCECESLRCHTDDGPNEEEMKRIGRTCMRRISGSEYDENNSDDNDSDDEDDNNNDGQNNNNNNSNNGSPIDNDRRRNQNHGRNWFFPNRALYRNKILRFRRFARNGYGYDNNNNGRNGNNNNNGDNNYNYQGWNNNNNGMGNQQNQSNIYQTGVRFDNNNNNRTNQTEQDRACILHCFFRELKMTNHDDFPDKHKILNVLTKDVRDRELKEFFTDSIEECFRMFDTVEGYRKQKDKCIMTQSIISCLTERLKVNCEDYPDDLMLS